MRSETQLTPLQVKAQPRFPVWLLVTMLALLTLAVYWPAMHNDFVNYDDHAYVVENVHVREGLSFDNLKWVFFHPVSANWHPLTMLSHMLDCELYGLNPWGHHLTNVLLQTFNTILFFLLLRGLTGAVWRSLAAAALFGVHPVHVESVAWVAERKDVLSGCFGLLSLIFYTRYAQERSLCEHLPFEGGTVAAIESQPAKLDYCLALVFLALGLMSKAMLVTWPFVMLLLDYWPLDRLKAGKLRGLVREKIPFFVMSVAASVVTYLVQKYAGAVANVYLMPLSGRADNALISYCRYLGEIFWPNQLAVFYPLPENWPLAKVLLAGSFLAGILIVLWANRRRYPFMLMGWLWYCGTLVPVIGLVQVGSQAMADRYTYIPSMGVLILLVWGVTELTRGWKFHVIVLSTTGLAAILTCTLLTRQQIGYWQDGEALFRHALEVTGENQVARANLGGALLLEGQIEEAISQYNDALRLNPHDIEAHNNLGYALLKKGRIDEAFTQFQEALRLNPSYVEAHNNLGMRSRKKAKSTRPSANLKKRSVCNRISPEPTTTSDSFSARKVRLTKPLANTRKHSV